MTPSHNELDNWPVLPEGVEGVTFHRLPADYDPPPADCAWCGVRILPGENVMASPGDCGIYHGPCWNAKGDSDGI